MFDDQFCIGRFGRNWFEKFLFVNAGTRWFKEQSNSYDLIHTIGDSDSCLSVARHAESLGKPSVLFVSIQDGRLIPKNDLKRMLGIYKRRQKTAQCYRAIIALSSEIDQQLQRVGVPQRKIARIPNFADTQRFRPVDAIKRSELRKRLGIRELPTVAFAGRLCARKQPHLIVEAIKHLRDQNIETQCVLAGPFDASDGYMTRLHSYLCENQLEHQVKLVGFTSEVEKWLQAADVFCLPSLSEGMPGALIEAIACGLPVIATSFSSAQEVVTDERLGCVLPIESESEAIADAIKSCISVRERDDSQTFRQRFIQDSFSLQAVADLHQALFDRVCTGADARI